MAPTPSWRSLTAIALVSAAVILLQIAVTRILSVILWYHWAFFSISVAMLGIGVPGVWLSFVRERERWLRPMLLGAAILVPLGIIAILRLLHFFGAEAILVCMVFLLPAALCLGGAICVLLLEGRGHAIGRLYAFDLLGACAGALVVIPLLWTVPTPQLAGAIGLLPLAAYALRGGRWITVVGVGGVILAATLLDGPFRLLHSKSYAENTRRTTPIYERWTPTARITIFDNIFFAKSDDAFGWGLARRPPQDRVPEQWWIEQDGSAGTPITRFDGDLERLRYLAYDVTGAGYEMRPARRAAIVGAGGGRDVLTARLAGVAEIDAIELNAAIVEALRGRFKEFSGGVYDLPGVRPIVGEGRSVLTRSEGGYDLIQIALTDSWAATAAGAYSLSENALYTVEAYRLYFSRLSPDGVVSTSRWLARGFGSELPRMILLVKEALRAEGVADPAAHMAILQGGAVGTILMSRSPIGPGDLGRLARLADERGFIVHWPPTDVPLLDDWLRRIVLEGSTDARYAALNLSPPTDDKPFFFQVLSPFQRISSEMWSLAGPNGEGIKALRQLMLVMGAVTVILFFAPFAFGRRARSHLGDGSDFWRGSLYFVALGLGFMLIELSWLQRLILYLGHPSLATTVGLAVMLAGAGLGSFCAQRLGLRRAARLGLLLPAVLLVLNSSLAPSFEATLGLPTAGRIAIAVGLFGPAAFLMGFYFPLGMVRFGERNRAWFWALNGAAGVLSSVLSLALCMQLGFLFVGQIGAAVYVAPWLLLRGRVGTEDRADSGDARAITR